VPKWNFCFFIFLQILQFNFKNTLLKGEKMIRSTNNKIIEYDKKMKAIIEVLIELTQCQIEKVEEKLKSAETNGAIFQDGVDLCRELIQLEVKKGKLEVELTKLTK